MQLLVGGTQLLCGALERARLALQRTRIRAYLGSFIQDAQHVAGREGFLLGHRGHERPGRCTAHGAGQLSFDKLHQTCVGPQGLYRACAHALRIRFKQRPCLGDPQKTLAQPQQVLRVRTPAPEHRAGGRCALKHIHKQQRLAGFAARGHAPERDTDVGHTVDQHAPEQRVREAIKSLQAQQLLGPQPVQSPGAVRNEAGIEPPRLGNRRKH